MDGMAEDDLQGLVRQALDEFDQVPVEVSVRRAYRVARRLGNTFIAHRLLLEISPMGRPDQDRAVSLLSIHGDGPFGKPGGLTIDDAHKQISKVYVEGRTIGDSDPANDGNVLLSSAGELRASHEQVSGFLQRALDENDFGEMPPLMDNSTARFEILERIRIYVFDFLVRTESELVIGDVVTQVLARHRVTVDELLNQVAPDLRDKLAAALRSAQDGDTESRSHVLTTCRRVIEKVADHLYPPSDAPHMSANGVERPVGKGQYRNRILAAVEERSTAQRAFVAAMDELAARLDLLDELTQKGVHDDVTEQEMEFGLVQTYLLAGELIAGGLQMRPESAVGD